MERWRKVCGGIQEWGKNGQGTLTSSSGKYVGEWKDGYFHGQGTGTFPHGEKFVGENNDSWKGTYYDKDGNIINKVVNGKIIKQ